MTKLLYLLLIIGLAGCGSLRISCPNLSLGATTGIDCNVSYVPVAEPTPAPTPADGLIYMDDYGNWVDPQFSRR